MSNPDTVPCPDCGAPIVIGQVDREEVRLDASLPVWQRYRDPVALADVLAPAAGALAEHRCAPEVPAKRGRQKRKTTPTDASSASTSVSESKASISENS